MKDNFTRIALILDRSGSMQASRESAIQGINDFVQGQKKVPGEAALKLVQFDDQYEVVFDKNIQDIPEFTQEDFKPRGRTALYDAQGKTIVELGEELSKLPEEQRPSHVIVVTITDGKENASRKFTAETVKALVTQQKEIYNWDFVYVGANQDAIAVGDSMGVTMDSALTYNSLNAQAYGQMVSSVFSYVASRRMGVRAAFTTEDRKKAR